jgi:lipoprotein-anchoring transpeptidase ErfK/SrfK
MERPMTAILSARLINVAAAAAFSASVAYFVQPSQAAAANQIVAKVDISSQTMEVSVDGRTAFEWKVSTAGKGYVTPRGAFKPTRMHEMWYSKKYGNAPMPHSVFFHGGYAVHATPHVKRLGTPASHGCVRLSPENASDFYNLVQAFGPTNTSIVIVE